MTFWMYCMLFILWMLRVFELYISKKNEQWLEARGGVEKEKRKYKWLYYLQQLFFLSILIEVLFFMSTETFHVFLFFSVMLISAGKLWCVLIPGRFWTLKNLMLPGVLLFKRGPYRFVKQPYHVITFIQLLIVPLLFGAYITAIVFPVCHLFMMQAKLPEKGSIFTKATS